MTRPHNKTGWPKKQQADPPDYKEITPDMTEMQQRDVEAHNQALRELEEKENRLKRLVLAWK